MAAAATRISAIPAEASLTNSARTGAKIDWSGLLGWAMIAAPFFAKFPALQAKSVDVTLPVTKRMGRPGDFRAELLALDRADSARIAAVRLHLLSDRCDRRFHGRFRLAVAAGKRAGNDARDHAGGLRSEEHTSELQ